MSLGVAPSVFVCLYVGVFVVFSSCMSTFLSQCKCSLLLLLLCSFPKIVFVHFLWNFFFSVFVKVIVLFLRIFVFFFVLIFFRLFFFSCDTRLRSDFFATILSAKAAAVNEIHYDDVVIENYYWKR